MINYLKGILISKQSNSPQGCNLTIEVNDIGYFIVTNRRVISKLPDVNEKIKIYTTLIHKEDSMTLCGFENHEDRDLFNILQSVSGVGTKVALLLLEEFSAGDLVSTVLKEDAKAISKTKGIGPKLAQRLILELKDKLTKWRDIKETEIGMDFLNETDKNKESILEAETVLLSLGYSHKEAEKALAIALERTIKKENSEEILKEALMYLSETV